LIRRNYPVLSMALLNGASGQLRNLATVGGNLLQRTRCLYFQDVTKPCNKREPGSGCPAREGEHHNHAVMAVALAALDATVHVESSKGARAIPVVDLHRLPGDTPDRDTVLEHDELITAVELPPLSFATRSTYRKVRERTSFAFAVVSVAAALDLAGGMVRDVRLALGGVAHKPWRATGFENALRGQPLTEASLRDAADRELSAARPLRDNGYKIPLARNVITRTFLELAS
jgi:xanthine dehydrogenase YagS FAD-binding subunit